MMPDFQYFPLFGWEQFSRMENPRKAGKFCADISFWDDFNDPRGPHGEYRHEANDIMANEGTFFVAPTGGVLWANVALGDKPNAWTEWEDGGWHAYLWGDDSVVYYGAHLLDAPFYAPGTRVKAGSIIGQVGRSGNAAGGCPHLHFAMRVGLKSGVQGKAIDPHPYLVDAFANINDLRALYGLAPVGNPKEIVSRHPPLPAWAPGREIALPRRVDEPEQGRSIVGMAVGIAAMLAAAGGVGYEIWKGKGAGR